MVFCQYLNQQSQLPSTNKMCRSYCRRAFNYVPAAVTQMISRILHSSLLCETVHIYGARHHKDQPCPPSCVGYSGTSKCSKISQWQQTVLLFEVIHMVHYNHISYFFNRTFNAQFCKLSTLMD